MGSVTADQLYQANYRTSWGDEEILGHMMIRRLDDQEVVVEVPVRTEEEARDLLARSDEEIRGPVADFERSLKIPAAQAAEPGPDTQMPAPVPTHLIADREPDGGEAISRGDARVRMLPAPADVFAEDQQWLARLLHPLVSIDLAAVDPVLSGWVHLLVPIEPQGGLLAENTTADHDAYAGLNWLTFRLDEDDRYHFLGQRRLFELEDCQPGDVGADSLHAWYAHADATFTQAQTSWRAGDGWVALEQLGGEPGYGNWASFAPPSSLRLDEQDPASPMLRLADGRPFTFVAATPGYPLWEDGPDAILVFIEPQTRTVALTFDWS